MPSVWPEHVFMPTPWQDLAPMSNNIITIQEQEAGVTRVQFIGPPNTRNFAGPLLVFARSARINASFVYAVEDGHGEYRVIWDGDESLIIEEIKG